MDTTQGGHGLGDRLKTKRKGEVEEEEGEEMEEVMSDQGYDYGDQSPPRSLVAHSSRTLRDKHAAVGFRHTAISGQFLQSLQLIKSHFQKYAQFYMSRYWLVV